MKQENFAIEIKISNININRNSISNLIELNLFFDDNVSKTNSNNEKFIKIFVNFFVNDEKIDLKKQF